MKTPTIHTVCLSACFAALLTSASSAQSQQARLDPQMQAVLDQHAELGPRPIEDLGPQEARRQPGLHDAVAALRAKNEIDPKPEAVKKVQDRKIPGAEVPIAARVYTPFGEGPFPVILFFHGGGWVLGNIDAYDASARALANATGAVVLSVEYRKAPEHQFPAAHEDAFAAYQWVRSNADVLNGDTSRIAVAGESAGGNLALNVSIMAQERELPLPVHQIIIYPVAGGNFTTPSYSEYAHAKPLNRAMMRWFFSHYLESPGDLQDPRIALVDADLRGLPPTTLITAEVDPLKSEGALLARRLSEAGVEVDHAHFEGVTHEFFGMGAVVDKAREAVQRVRDDLGPAFSDICITEPEKTREPQP